MNDNKRAFIPLYRDILQMVELKKISLTSMLIYILLLDRNKITKFKDKDRDNQKYVVFTHAELKRMLNLNSHHTINKCIFELEKIGLISTDSLSGESKRFYILDPGKKC